MTVDVLAIVVQLQDQIAQLTILAQNVQHFERLRCVVNLFVVVAIEFVIQISRLGYEVRLLTLSHVFLNSERIVQV